MLALALLTYKVPLDEVARHTDDHRAYLRTLHAAGKLVASGPFVPRTGGALLYRAESEEELQALVQGDPFYTREIAAYDVKVWAPTLGAELLEPK